MRTVVPLLAAAALLLTAAPAGADAGEDARRFNEAALRTKAMIATHADEVADATAALRPCFELVMQAPAHASDRASAVLAVEVVYEVLHPAEPILRRLVADLEAVATTDRSLRAGRMAWRRALAIFSGLPHLGDPCAVLERWREAGWSAQAAPPDLSSSLARLEHTNGGKVVRRWMRCAVHRLQELGISRRAAHRFAGDGMFDVLLVHALTLIQPAEPL